MERNGFGACGSSGIVPPEFQKTQWIRALDVWVIGPLMIFASTSRKLPGWAKLSLGVAGFLTIAYNAENYRLNSQIKTLPVPPPSD